MAPEVLPLRLRQARKACGLRQVEVANRLGWCRSILSNYEHARLTPPLGRLVALANHYGTSLDWLCGLPTASQPAPRALAGSLTLLGTEERQLDNRGRLCIPADWLAQLSLPLVARLTPDSVVEVWDLTSWTTFHPGELPSWRLEVRLNQRTQLPESLRRDTGLHPGNPAWLHGVGHYFRVARTRELAEARL